MTKFFNMLNLEKFIKPEKRSKKRINVLLFGTRGSGKTTIAKQFRLRQETTDRGRQIFSQPQLSLYRTCIHKTIFCNLRILLSACRNCNLELLPQNQPLSEKYLNGKSDGLEIKLEMTVEMLSLWQDPAVRKVFFTTNPCIFPDSCEYFFENLIRIARDNYIPNEKDFLFCYEHTLGLFEQEIVLPESRSNLRLFDIGDQTGAFSKWTKYFSESSPCESTVLLYCVDLSSYDCDDGDRKQPNSGQRVVDGMKTSLQLFDQVCNDAAFASVQRVLLILNKSDLFRKKLSSIPLNYYFPSYQGGDDLINATQFIESQFLRLNRNNKVIQTHLTSAINTANFSFVLSSFLPFLCQESS